MWAESSKVLKGHPHSARLSKADLRLEDPAVSALGTLPRLRQLVLAEREAARSALGRDDDNAMTRGAGGTDHVPHRVFDVRAREPELPRQTRDRSRILREIVNQLLA